MALLRVVADTDLVIDFLRGAGPGAPAVERWLRQRRLFLTTITAFELRLGRDFLARGRDLAWLFRRPSLPLDLESALRAGEVFARLRDLGSPIDRADSLQAGICLRYGLPLATRNLRHFERVDGLRLASLDD
ncbi:MAG: type II toxin-antitoxin system VapC family toxin [Acidimicrobiia bacterium]